MNDDIKQLEQTHLHQVIGEMQGQIEKTEHEIKNNQDKLETINQGWDEVKFKQGDYNAIVETASSIRQQQQQIQQRENALNSSERRLEVLRKQIDKPYFARIDFKEKGSENSEKETVYIGIGTFAKDDNNYLVYDWRAPISSIYYDGGLGDVDYQTPSGTKTADVSLKRQFQIEDQEIKSVFDTEETIGDQLLLDALSHNSSAKMKSIVTTIQREQNQIIRDTDSDLLFVQGAAGSGKTAAVLQRIAYLLYRYRGNVNSGQVILFSPNQLFNDYVNQVLPDLGEQNMVQMTFYQFVNYRLPKIAVQSLAKRFEIDNKPENIKIESFKGDIVILKYINQFIELMTKSGLTFRDLKVGDRVVISGKEISDIYYGFHSGYTPFQRLDATKTELEKLLNARFNQELNSQWVEDAIQLLTEKEVIELLGNSNDREFESEEKEKRQLAKKIVKQAFLPLSRKISRGSFLNPNRIFSDFLKYLAQNANLEGFDITRELLSKSVDNSIQSLKNKTLSTNDSAIYLYLFDLITGRHGQTDIRFVFIDEVQDYTPLQLAFMKHSFPKAKFTLLGDLNQAIFTGDQAVNIENELKNLFGFDRTRTIKLQQTYRSTQQISDFASAVLGNNQEIISFERDGSVPIVYKTDKTKQDDLLVEVIDELKQTDQTIAIITKNENQAKEIHKLLEEKNLESNLIISENQRLTTGLIIVPSYLAKGLEFDAVILPEVSDGNYSIETEKRLFYTLSTRAMHDLRIIANAGLPSVIENIDNKLYELKE